MAGEGEGVIEELTRRKARGPQSYTEKTSVELCDSLSEA